MATPSAPPVEPGSSEVTGRRLERAAAQGETSGKALDHTVQDVAKTGGTHQVGYATEDAEGMYHLQDCSRGTGTSRLTKSARSRAAEGSRQ